MEYDAFDNWKGHGPNAIPSVFRGLENDEIKRAGRIVGNQEVLLL